MNKLTLLILILSATYLHAQQSKDTIDLNLSMDYKYEKVGNKHYLVATVINATDGSEQIKRIPKASKKDVDSLIKNEILALQNNQDIYNKEIEESKKKLANYDEMLMNNSKSFEDFRTQLRMRIEEEKTKIRNANTSKKLSKESLDKLRKL